MDKEEFEEIWKRSGEAHKRFLEQYKKEHIDKMSEEERKELDEIVEKTRLWEDWTDVFPHKCDK